MKMELGSSGGALRRQFARYVAPSVAAQWVFALYTMVDGMFVARGVGEAALAAVNLSLPFVNFIFAVSLVMAVGSSTVVAICFGAENAQKANEAYTQNLLCVAGLSLLLAAAVLLGLGPLARFLGATPATLYYVTTYVGTIAAFTPCFMLAYYFEILIKADGRPKLATAMVALGCALNCVLDYVLVFVAPLGVFGAALATGLSQLAVALCFAAYFFVTKKARLKVVRFRFSLALALRTLRLGLPAGVTDFSAGLMIFFFNHAILMYIGEWAVVSYTIVAYVNTILVMSLTGIAQGMQPLASYAHGAGNRTAARRLLKMALLTAGGFSAAVLALTWPFAEGIVAVFISPANASLRDYSAGVFRVFSLSFIPVGFNVIASGWLSAVEREKPATAISLGRGLVLLVLCLWALAALLGGEGIWWAPTLSELLCAALTGALLWAATRKGARGGTQGWR